MYCVRMEYRLNNRQHGVFFLSQNLNASTSDASEYKFTLM